MPVMPGDSHNSHISIYDHAKQEPRSDVQMFEKSNITCPVSDILGWAAVGSAEAAFHVWPGLFQLMQSALTDHRNR